MDWFRWWHGAITDPKMQMVAAESGLPLAAVLGVWSSILEHASMNDPRGQFKWEPDVLSFHLGIDVVTPCNAMKHRGLLHVTDGVLHIANWEKRQPKRERDDDSSARVKKHRELKKQELTECNANVTPRNANVTHETPREDKRREEKETSIIDVLISDGVSQEVAKDYLIHRKDKKATLTGRAWKHIKSEINKTTLSLDEGLDLAMNRGWIGFESKWAEKQGAEAPTSFATSSGYRISSAQV